MDHTDIVFDLIHDEVHNVPGLWLRLHGPRRAHCDPRLDLLTDHPLDVLSQTQHVARLADAFRLPSPTTQLGERTTMETVPSAPHPVPLKAVCHTNAMRVAANTRMGAWFRALHPQAPTRECRLRQVYLDSHPAPPGLLGVAALEDRYRRYLQQQGRHTRYLQDFVYAVGMPVYCKRNKPYRPRELPPDAPRGTLCLTNARKAVIQQFQSQPPKVVLQWWDAVPGETPDWDCTVTLALEEFVFAFVPGFCVTAHLAQGDTFREDYVVLEWDDMSARSRYVALTRAGTLEDHSRDAERYVWNRSYRPGGDSLDPWDPRRHPAWQNLLPPSVRGRYADHDLWHDPVGLNLSAAVCRAMMDECNYTDVHDGCISLALVDWYRTWQRGGDHVQHHACAHCGIHQQEASRTREWLLYRRGTPGDPEETVERSPLRRREISAWARYHHPCVWVCASCYHSEQIVRRS